MYKESLHFVFLLFIAFPTTKVKCHNWLEDSKCQVLLWDFSGAVIFSLRYWVLSEMWLSMDLPVHSPYKEDSWVCCSLLWAPVSLGSHSSNYVCVICLIFFLWYCYPASQGRTWSWISHCSSSASQTNSLHKQKPYFYLKEVSTVAEL